MPQPQLLSHHKEASVRRSGVAAADRLAGRLVVEGLAPGENGIVVERVHEVGLHVAEEVTDLRCAGGEEEKEEEVVEDDVVLHKYRM